MSFQGFTDQTLAYFLNISLDNSKTHFEALRAAYESQVKAPLRALHEALTPTLLKIDRDICVKPSRCISGAYNDARFSRSAPIKTYMYLHFLAETGREQDIPGFFMDASYDGWRYGLQLYHATTEGMSKLRDAVLENSAMFAQIANDIDVQGLFALEGDSYKKDHYPDAPPVLKNWLNRKRWWLGRTLPPDEEFFSPAMASVLSEGFASLGKLYHFMREGLL